MEKATFAAGCFWGVETSFRKLKGVVDAQVGYIGGKTDKPTYKDVCRGDTDHAEAVEVTFDPTQISYETLLRHFWSIHNPTTRDRQGPDIGSQYRSAIFYHSLEQKAAAELVKSQLEKTSKYVKPFVTQIAPAPKFFRAEEYHQRYNEKNGFLGCHI